jgi:hypothetical protein
VAEFLVPPSLDQRIDFSTIYEDSPIAATTTLHRHWQRELDRVQIAALEHLAYKPLAASQAGSYFADRHEIYRNYRSRG